MKATERLFYFSKNLLAFLLGIIVIPFHMIFGIYRMAIVVFFITDGSEEIAFPWEWNWKN